MSESVYWVLLKLILRDVQWQSLG